LPEHCGAPFSMVTGTFCGQIRHFDYGRHTARPEEIASKHGGAMDFD